jgi:hypothetical protein
MNPQKSGFEELTAGMSHDAREDLAARLRDMQTSVNACTVLMFFVFAFSIHYALASICGRLTNSDPDALLSVPYQPGIWWFFPCFGGFTMAWELTLQLWSLIGRRKTANQYRELAKTFLSSYRGQMAAFQTQTFMKWVAILLALPIGVFSALALNMHTNFESAGLRECGYAFHTCQLHAYSELTGVIHSDGVINSHGHYVKKPNVVLEFRSGYHWRSSTYELGDKATIQRIEELAIEKSGLQLESVPSEPAVPKSQPPVQ